MALTTPDNIWSPDADTPRKFVTVFRAMAESIQDAITAKLGNTPGVIGWTAASTPPPGALMMDGQAVSRTTYANLFAAIGTTYGSGDGSTTFNLPDARGRTFVHKSASGTFSSLNNKPGAETHTLTVSQMPSHNHGGSTNSSTLGTVTYGLNPSSADSRNVPAGGGGGSNPNNTWNTSAHSHTIPSQGGGGAHNNIQPSIVFNGFIYY